MCQPRNCYKLLEIIIYLWEVRNNKPQEDECERLISVKVHTYEYVCAD